MLVFSPMSDDIDRTQPGQPYIIDSTGWGWFMLLYLSLLPFLYLFAAVAGFAVFFANHVALFLTLYLAAALIISIVLYRKRSYRHRAFGRIAVVLTMLPPLLLTVFYAVPYAVLKPGFDSTLEFFLVLLLTVGGQVLVFSIARLRRDGLRHFFISLIFFGLSILLLYLCLSTEQDQLPLDTVWSIY